MGVAFLWEARAPPREFTFQALLAQLPSLDERLRDADFDSSARGAGPLLQHVKGRVAPRFALVGDAAGYVDAITGEG